MRTTKLNPDPDGDVNAPGHKSGLLIEAKRIKQLSVNHTEPDGSGGDGTQGNGDY